MFSYKTKTRPFRLSNFRKYSYIHKRDETRDHRVINLRLMKEKYTQRIFSVLLLIFTVKAVLKIIIWPNEISIKITNSGLFYEL